MFTILAQNIRLRRKRRSPPISQRRYVTVRLFESAISVVFRCKWDVEGYRKKGTKTMGAKVTYTRRSTPLFTTMIVNIAFFSVNAAEVQGIIRCKGWFASQVRTIA